MFYFLRPTPRTRVDYKTKSIHLSNIIKYLDSSANNEFYNSTSPSLNIAVLTFFGQCRVCNIGDNITVTDRAASLYSSLKFYGIIPEKLKKHISYNVNGTVVK